MIGDNWERLAVNQKDISLSFLADVPDYCARTAQDVASSISGIKENVTSANVLRGLTHAGLAWGSGFVLVKLLSI